MMAPLVIAPRFCGPPDSGNGGYMCGLIAARLAGQASLSVPIPAALRVQLVLGLRFFCGVVVGRRW